MHWNSQATVVQCTFTKNTTCSCLEVRSIRRGDGEERRSKEQVECEWIMVVMEEREVLMSEDERGTWT